MSTPEIGKTILGMNGAIVIAGTSYNIKRSMNLHIGREIYKDATAAGYFKHFGQRDDYLDLEIYIQAADLTRLAGYAESNDNGETTARSVSIVFTSIDGTSSTLTGLAFIQNIDMADSDPYEKSTATIHIEFDHDGASVS